MGAGPAGTGPVAIGGVGGSGTRVVAGFLRELGFYMGADLNQASDNLWFSLLLNRSRWFARSSREEKLEYLAAFDRAMTGRFGGQPGDLRRLGRAAYGMTFSEYLHWGQTPLKRTLKSIWPARVTATLLWAALRSVSLARSGQVDRSRYAGWGWKEPCTYVYLEYLCEFYEDLKYIHVIRNGLDMAYSDNQGHLLSWGDEFGVQVPDSAEAMPKASLGYWCRANETTISRGRELLGDRFLVINYDELCVSPRGQLVRLKAFLDLDDGAMDLAKLGSMCRVPSSLGRYRQYDTRFDRATLATVQRLGFGLDDKWLARFAEG